MRVLNENSVVVRNMNITGYNYYRIIYKSYMG